LVFRREPWLRQTSHDQEAVGLNPGIVYWMDVSDASYYIQEYNEIKVAEWGTPKKYLKNTIGFNKVVIQIQIEFLH
jgi:hypothetical protein